MSNNKLDRIGLFNNFSILKCFITLGLAYSISLMPAFGQQIVPDGYTNTLLDINGKTTNVSTSTIKGNNAFNSFSKFDVYQGNTVNLLVPGQSTNLINIIKSQATNIDGILNSIKNNQIGGNIFLVNPHGIFIGKQGVLNVGSLTAITPTKAFTDNFFDSPGNPNDNAVNILLNGKAPINSEAQISIAGQLNATNKIKLDTGNLTNSGTIQIADIVNLNEAQNADNLNVKNGEILIQTTKDTINTGKIIADGENNINAGNIDIDANNNIKLASNSLVSAKGHGKNSNGGNINILAQNTSLFDNNAVIDVSGGYESGNGGFVELSAKNKVQLAGEFIANATNGDGGTILVDPPTLDIVANQFSNGANISFQADNKLTVANGIIISSRNVANYLTADHLTAPSIGNSGNITLSSNNIELGLESKLYAHTDNAYSPGNITLQATNANATIKLGGLVYTNGTLQYTSQGSISNVNYNTTPYNVGGTINLTANNGAIGTNDSYILTNLFDSNTGSINATATGNIYLKSTKDMRIGQLNSTGPADIYITTNNSKIIDALNGANTNITARNFFVQLTGESQNYYFIGINGDATNEKNQGFMTFYLNTLKNHGQNWFKSPNANFKIFDDSAASFTENDILNAISNFANKLKQKDVLLIVYNGHGYGGDPNPQYGEDGLYNGYDGNPLDESVSGSTALNAADEGMALNSYYISDDEFANALKNSKGTVVYLSGQCYGGGFFGGTSDLDKVAQANGFSYYGVTANIEGKLSWGTQYSKSGQNYNFVSNLHQAMIDTLTDTNPTLTSMNSNATSAYDWHTVNLPRAYNTNGNVYLNEWYNSVNQEPSYYAYYDNYTYHYPYKYTNFTNMTSSQLQAAPILNQNWQQTTTSLVDSVGTANFPLKVNLSGDMQVSANNFVGISGNVAGTTNIISNQGNIQLAGTFTGNVSTTANNSVYINQATGNLSVDKITANNSSVTLTAAGNILNASTTGTTNIVSNSIYLQSNAGNIGSSTTPLGLTMSGGSLTALANGLINVSGLNSSLNLNAISNAGNSDVTITASSNILDGVTGENPNIYAKNITLNATSGNIGSSSDDLNIYLNYGTSGGSLTANASGLININQNSGHIYLNNVTSTGSDVKLTAWGNILDNSGNENANVTGNNISIINVITGSIGLFSDSVDIHLNGGVLSTQAYGYIGIKETTGDLKLNLASNAGRSEVNLYANGSILDGLSGENPNIYAQGITLTSNTGGVGSSSDDVNILLNYNTTGGTLTSNAPGIINLKQNSGHLYLNHIYSTNNDVKLYAPGNILDYSADANANVIGNNISLINVSTGSVGLFSDDVDIHLNGGTLSAQAYGYIGLKELTGDMRLNLASNAGRSSVKLTSFGNLLSSDSNSTPKIYAQGITLNALNGDIGNTNSYLDVYLNYYTSGGTLSSVASGNKYIRQH